jgi:RNA polymerase sigma factor (sigma-70 family)
MVLGVCFRIVGNHHDAEDAFQATFLVLASKAASVWPREMVANWLHGVAYRSALKARTIQKRRQLHEKQVKQMPEPEAAQPERSRDLHEALDEELSRLPTNYRLPIVLCDLEGKTIKAASDQLGWPQGTLAGRLARGRKRLARRLTQRGALVSGTALAAVLSEQAALARVPLTLVTTTSRAAIAFATGKAAENLVCVSVVALTQGVLNSMIPSKLKVATIALLALSLVAFGSGLFSRQVATGQEFNSGQQRAVPENDRAAFRVEPVPGTQDMRYSAAFRQQKPEQKSEQPASSQQTKKTAEVLDEEKLQGEWIAVENELHVSIFFGPKDCVQRIVESHPSGPDDKGTYTVDWSKYPHYLDIQWGKLTPVGTIMAFAKDGRLRIEIGGNIQNARPKEFTSDSILLTKVEKAAAGSKQAESAAASDLDKAEFYHRARKFGSAQFYYELVCHRYPDTEYARKAQLALKVLQKHRIPLRDGSEGWEAPDENPRPQPPPRAEVAPAIDHEVNEFRQRVMSLENRIAALEGKGSSQAAQPAYDGSTATQEMEVLKRRLANLEGRLAALEAKGNKKADGEKILRIGKVVIVGDLPSKPELREKAEAAVLKQLQLFPGAMLDSTALQKAQMRAAGFNATIEVIGGNDAEYKDIVVRVGKQ